MNKVDTIATGIAGYGLLEILPQDNRMQMIVAISTVLVQAIQLARDIINKRKQKRAQRHKESLDEHKSNS